MTWFLRAHRFFRISWHWGQGYSDDSMCFASIWHLTLNFWEAYPHSTHCHLPPPRPIINDSKKSARKTLFEINIIYCQLLWNFAMWCFKAILFLRTSLHFGQLYPEQMSCLASTWHLTLNFLLETYPQLRHCHWPSSCLVMKDSTTSGRKAKVFYFL